MCPTHCHIQGGDTLCRIQLFQMGCGTVPHVSVYAAQDPHCVPHSVRVFLQVIPVQIIRQSPGAQAPILFVVQPHIPQICRIVPHIHGLSNHLECRSGIHIPQLLSMKQDLHAITLDLLHSGGAGKHKIQILVSCCAHSHFCNGPVPDLDPAHAFVLGFRSTVFFAVKNAIDPGFQRFTQHIVPGEQAILNDGL